MRHSREYEPLSSDDVSLDDLAGHGPRQARASQSPNRFIACASFCVAFSTLLSVAITLINFGFPAASAPTSSTITMGRHRPNQYVNLDRVIADNIAGFDPILNFPSVTLQMSNSDSHRLMHEESKERPTKFGTVYPDDRHVLVTHETSTIVQFRHFDFRMESCELQFQMPHADSVHFFDPKTNITEGSCVDVWTLDAPTELSRYIPGSMDVAPPRKSLLTSVCLSSISPSRFGKFTCRSGEFTVLELTCPKPTGNISCSVDFWQDRRIVPPGGVFITQYPSSD